VNFGKLNPDEEARNAAGPGGALWGRASAGGGSGGSAPMTAEGVGTGAGEYLALGSTLEVLGYGLVR
jgi:hypothetical protein